MSDFALGTVMAILAGLFNGLFLLPMRYTKNWKWENTWLCFTLLSTVILPWMAAVLAVPHLLNVFQISPFRFLLPGLIAGSVWGIAQVLYGLGVDMLGVAIGSAVIVATAAVAGTVGPLVAYAPSKLFGRASLVLALSVTLIAIGMRVYAKAGKRREFETKAQQASGPARVSPVLRGGFATGLFVCLLSGVLGTAFIYGGKSSNQLVEAAKGAGASPLLAFYAAYAVTFSAGMIPMLTFSIYRLLKSESAGNFMTSGALLWNLFLAASMAFLWYGGILMYGMSSEKLGRLGPSIAFVLFAGGTVLFANIFGWLAGEWKNATRSTIRGFVQAMVLLVAAIVVVALGLNQTK